MPVLRKRSQGEKPSNGLYIHSSPPRVLQINSAHIKQIIRSGDLERIEQLVIDGHGNKLIGEYSADYKTRTFLKSIPALMSQISLLHDAVNSGRLEELQTLLEEYGENKRKLVACKDDAGVGLLHKAVYYDLRKIYKWLIQQFPFIVSIKDSEGRTAYHYTPMCKDPKTVQKLLTTAGADAACLDFRQHSAKYYANHIQELELPTSPKYFNTQQKNSPYKESLNFKKSNIRIWIHQRNLGNLQQVVWEGHGSKLLVEHSNNGKIKRFLEAVPHIMGLISFIHTDVINGDLEALKNHVNPPIPNIVLTGKDSNGLTPLHKAAGLGKEDIVEFLLAEVPETLNSQDNNRRTPLHYSALLKDDGKMTNYLIEKGADESALDKKQKTAAYYKTRSSELDGKLLSLIPECPRSAKESFAANFDWNMLTAPPPPEESPKSEKKDDDETTTPENGEEKPPEEVAADTNGNVEEPEPEPEVEPEPSPQPTPQPSPQPSPQPTPQPSPQPSASPENNAEETASPENDVEETASPENGVEENGITPEPPETENNNVEEPELENNNNQEEVQNVTPAATPEINVEEPERPNSTALTRPSSKQSNASSRPSSRAVSRPPSQMIQEEEEEQPEIEAEGVIEGVVNGEDEVETLNDEGRGRDEEDIKALVEAGNMEQLAGLVLNGEGDKLVGHTSDNAELQSFLENVPVYMSKINRIHMASREGSLRDLQAALDRRKFAVAKDPVSPNGASPLHVAVVFGNTSIVRYLAGRFPETLQVLDDNSRTPLHYAATLADNGHYYNLLVHLGADTRIPDKLGYTADFYRTHNTEFSHNTLLRDFGADETASEEMLNDKIPDDRYSARKDLDDEDMISVLDRCYNVLHGRRNSNAISATSSSSQTSIISSSLLCKHMKRYVFDTVKLRLTKYDHNLYDLIWPSVKKLPTETRFRIALQQDFPTGIVAPDFCVYYVFRELLEPVIKDFNSIDLHYDLGAHPSSKFVEVNQDGAVVENVDIDLDLDPALKWIISDQMGNQVDMPFFATEEGRYLASSLGDPLIKGLTEVANKRPEDPIAYLATYLYNFANISRGNVKSRGRTQENAPQMIRGSPQTVNDNNAIPASIDVVTVEPDENGVDEDSAFSNASRDEHGQSMLHFAAARAHGRNALFHLLLETDINVAFRDELYRTARDISIQANIPENTEEIDRYVLHIATQGNTDKLVELLLDGYDHITDIVDEDDVPINEAVAKHNQADTVSFLQSILAFEEKRERVHYAIRQGSLSDVTSLLADENDTGSGKLLSIGKNSYGRCTLHIAVLCQQEEIVDYLANTFPDTLKLGDNLERTALHYAMGVEKMETISRVLIKAGAKRIVKDLKGRQPTYYFLNKSEILRLQEEEETF